MLAPQYILMHFTAGINCRWDYSSLAFKWCHLWLWRNCHGHVCIYIPITSYVVVRHTFGMYAELIQLWLSICLYDLWVGMSVRLDITICQTFLLMPCWLWIAPPPPLTRVDLAWSLYGIRFSFSFVYINVSIKNEQTVCPWNLHFGRRLNLNWRSLEFRFNTGWFC